MRALARVDASTQIGFGHLARTSTLARALAAKGVDVSFACHAPSEAVVSWVSAVGCKLHSIAAAPGSREDGAETRALAEGAELVVVDGYVFDATYHAALRDHGRAVCVIDDLADARVGADIVLNGNLYAAELSYDAPHASLSLLGPAYALVRAEFARARREKIARERASGGPLRLLVTMGGADPTGETDKALDALADLALPLHARVVLGGANVRSAALAARAADLDDGANRRVESITQASHMGELMTWADLALTAAGSTCLELATVGVPGLTITVADNQRGVAAAFASRGLLESLGQSQDVTARAIRDAVAALAADVPRRARMETAQREAVDGEGAARAADAIVKHLRASRA